MLELIRICNAKVTSLSQMNFMLDRKYINLLFYSEREKGIWLLWLNKTSIISYWQLTELSSSRYDVLFRNVFIWHQDNDRLLGCSKILFSYDRVKVSERFFLAQIQTLFLVPKISSIKQVSQTFILADFSNAAFVPLFWGVYKFLFCRCHSLLKFNLVL